MKPQHTPTSSVRARRTSISENSKKVILLCGGTGFIGKALLERLLQQNTYDDVDRVYVLVRPKRGYSPQLRLKELSVASIFTDCREAFDAQKKVICLSGDITKPSLGLSPDDFDTVIANVTHIINLAASVRFDLSLVEVSEINIGGALNVLDLAENCTRLARLVHCSTAYVNPNAHVNATVAKEAEPISEALSQSFTSKQAEAVYDHIRNGKISHQEEKEMLKAAGLPNTYTFSKCLAEHLLTGRSGSIPLVIVRPSIVSASLFHPSPGWIDSKTAIAGMVFMIGGGFMHTGLGDSTVKVDVVPCDYVVERLLFASFVDKADEQYNAIIHATAGFDSSATTESIYDEVISFFGGTGRKTFLKPFIRTRGTILDPKVQRSMKKDQKRLRNFAKLMRFFGKKRNEKVLKMAAHAIDIFAHYFAPFVEYTYHFESAKPITEWCNDFDAQKYMEVLIDGVYFNLLRQEDK